MAHCRARSSIMIAACLASAAWLPTPPGQQTSSHLGRRAIIQQLPLSVAAFAAAASVPSAALADLGDLSIDMDEAPKAMTTTTAQPADGSTAVMMLTQEQVIARRKNKEQTPYDRIKELQAKGGSMTDKEKKELKRCACSHDLRTTRAAPAGRTAQHLQELPMITEHTD